MLCVDNPGATDFANVGAIVLCGGRSVRLGRDKASLPCGSGETMLQRVVRLLGQVVPAQRIVCAAAPRQQLPPLPLGVRLVYDARPHAGPLAGLAAGLVALTDGIEAAFVTGCDAPLLVPALVRRMFELLADYEIAAPYDGRRLHPLAAVYRIDVLPAVEAQLAGRDHSLVALLDKCRTRRVPTDELREVDPDMASLANCNTLEDYQAMVPSRRPHEPEP
jgi:molybdenum cofactor guanylyltransferase